MENTLNLEEVCWSQRVKSEWLKDGDKTRYFHPKSSQRMKNNYIHQIKGNGGRVYNDKQDIEKISFHTSTTSSLPMVTNTTMTSIG